MAHTLIARSAAQGYGEGDVPGISGFRKSKIAGATRSECLRAAEVGCAALIRGVV